MSELTPTPISEEAEIARQVLLEIIGEMQFPSSVSVDIEETDDQVTLIMRSEDQLGLLIGKGGQTLNAVELLVRTITQHRTKAHGKRLVIDAEGYRQQQTERIETMVQEAAERVRDTGECISLEPMNARDRRTVHTAIAEIEGVESTSQGEDPYRHVIICPAGTAPEE